MICLRDAPHIRPRTVVLLLGLALFTLLPAPPAPGAAPLDLPRSPPWTARAWPWPRSSPPASCWSRSISRAPPPPAALAAAAPRAPASSLTPSGLILTNQHMIEGRHHRTVYLPGGEKLERATGGRRLRRDLAVLRVRANRPLPFAVLGDSDRERPGRLGDGRRLSLRRRTGHYARLRTQRHRRHHQRHRPRSRVRSARAVLPRPAPDRRRHQPRQQRRARW